MKVQAETGVLSPSERFFSTPSAVARRLLFYITRCGHYYCDTQYDFHGSCEIGQEESHRNFFLLYLRSGSMGFETDLRRETASHGQCALLDCRRPHRYYAMQDAETMWIHFDGANARAFYEQLLLQNNGHFVMTPTPESRIERTLAQIISGMRDEKTPWTEVEYSKRIYQILCDLLYPPLSHESQEGHPVTQAMRFIHEHLFEDLSVEQIAASVNLSPSHFSRQFRAHTGFSPHEYLVLHRIDEAKALLHGTALSVKEIAYHVGYHSEVNFITSFKSKTGVSPTVFRNTPL